MPYIEIPTSLADSYDTDANRGLIKPGRLHIPFPDGGGRISPPEVERAIYKGIEVTYVEKVLNLQTIEITTPESRSVIADILEQVAKEADDSEKGYFLVYDYAFFKQKDRVGGVTLRKMTLKSVSPLSPLLHTYDPAIGVLSPKGWEIVLEEVDYEDDSE